MESEEVKLPLAAMSEMEPAENVEPVAEVLMFPVPVIAEPEA